MWLLYIRLKGESESEGKVQRWDNPKGSEKSADTSEIYTKLMLLFEWMSERVRDRDRIKGVKGRGACVCVCGLFFWRDCPYFSKDSENNLQPPKPEVLTSKRRSEFGNRDTGPQVQEALKLHQRMLELSRWVTASGTSLFIWRTPSTSTLLKECWEISPKFATSFTYKTSETSFLWPTPMKKQVRDPGYP